jgi:hypothetical protein
VPVVSVVEDIVDSVPDISETVIPLAVFVI